MRHYEGYKQYNDIPEWITVNAYRMYKPGTLSSYVWRAQRERELKAIRWWQARAWNCARNPDFFGPIHKRFMEFI